MVGNPQVWYTGSAVDQTIHEDGIVFARVRERGHKGRSFARVLRVVVSTRRTRTTSTTQSRRDRKRWAQANPGLGIRISEEHIEMERARSARARSRSSGSASATGPTPTDGAQLPDRPRRLWNALTDVEVEAARPRLPRVRRVARPLVRVDQRRRPPRDNLFHGEVIEHVAAAPAGSCSG
jgi:hypothetical protein